jgi:hypothetical protein
VDLARPAPARPGLREALLDGHDQRVEIDRLPEDAEPPRFLQIAGVAGDDDYREAACARVSGDFLVDGSAADARQSDIQDDEGGQAVLEMIERVEAVGDRLDFVSGYAERGRVQRAEIRIIFDNEDPSPSCHP